MDLYGDPHQHFSELVLVFWWL